MLRDLRLARRRLRAAPPFALVAVLSLALGVAANVTALSWAEGAVLRPFPLVREALADAAVVTALGGALGVLAAAWARRALVALVPSVGLPLRLDAPLDARVLGVTLVVGALAALLAGLAPALRAARTDPAALLRAGGRGATRSPRLVGLLVSAQVALATVALVCAGLFVRTVAELRRVDTGMRGPGRVLVVRTDFGYVGRRDEAAQRQSVDRLLERLGALPGVRAVGAADFVPLGNMGSDWWTTAVDGYTPGPGEQMAFGTTRVTPGYFATVGTPIVRGRGFTDADRDGAPRVVVVSEAFARRFFRGGDAVGRTVRFGGGSTPYAIVGVARDARYRGDDLAGAPVPFIYQSYAQAPIAGVAFLLRADRAGDARALAVAVRTAAAAVDPALPLTAPVTLAEWTANATLLQRVVAAALGALGAFALALAAVGVFGVVAYAVAQRRREVGVRVALGAPGRAVVAAFVRDGARRAAYGLGAGALLAFAAARLVRGQLYGVSAADPAAFGAAAAALLAAVLAASWIPARRAARVPPTEALRAE